MRQRVAFWGVMLMAALSSTALAQRVEPVAIDGVKAEGAKGWTGTRTVNADGRLARCTAAQTLADGSVLKVYQDRTRALFLNATHPKWALTVGGKETVRVSVDKGRGAPIEAPVVADEGVVVTLTEAPELVAGLRAGRELFVKAGKGSAVFPLAGTRKALAGISGCVDAALAAEAAPPPVVAPVPVPFATPPAAAPPPPVAEPAPTVAPAPEAPPAAAATPTEPAPTPAVVAPTPPAAAVTPEPPAAAVVPAPLPEPTPAPVPADPAPAVPATPAEPAPVTVPAPAADAPAPPPVVVVPPAADTVQTPAAAPVATPAVPATTPTETR